MDKTENIKNKSSLENLCRLDEDTTQFLDKIVKTAFKIGCIVIREIGYMQTAIVTFPKERWMHLEKYRKPIKIALPIIFGIGTYFFWNTPIGAAHLFFILFPSWMLYILTSPKYAAKKLCDHYGVN